MRTKLDEAKDELLERAARVAENSPAGNPVLAFLQSYYLNTAPEDLIDLDPVDVFGAAVSHYRLAENRRFQGIANVRVHTPTVEENGWTCSHSVIEVVTDDMPFLVSSVTNELSRQGRGIHVVIHPQYVVRRDITGKLIELLSTRTGGELPHNAHIESWIHVEIDRETDRGDLKQITADLMRVLADVREAVEDWERMRDAALRIAEALRVEPVPDDLPYEDVEEAGELLRWLADDHFTFLGYREYQLRDDDTLAAVPGTGLGILRSDPCYSEEGHPVSPSFERLPADARAKAREHKLLILTKANSRSTVRRPSYLDYIGVKRFDENGDVVGERRIVGLFSSAAYTESMRRVPVIRRKIDEVLKGAGFSPNGHKGRNLLEILETYPRDELFQTPADELRSIVTSVLYLQERRRLRLYLRQDDYGRYYSALIYLPRDRYTTGVRLRIIDILKEELGGISVDFTAWNTESILSRLHFVIRVPQGTELPELSDADKERIETRLVEAARSWADGFTEALNAECGEEKAAELLRKYGNAFPEGYKADHPPRAAVADLLYLQRLTPGGNRDFALSLYEPIGGAADERRFKIFRSGGQVSLSTVLPVLSQLGVEVVDERPYELRCADRTTAWIYDFGLRLPQSQKSHSNFLDDLARERFQDAFAAAWTGQAENDGFNALVLAAGLTWRQAMVLRAYAKYLHQAGSAFSQDYMEDTLRNNVHVTRLLILAFEARMSPNRQTAGTEVADAVFEELDHALDHVSSLDQGRILRLFLSLIKATLRTNFFQFTPADRPHPYLSIKFDSHAVPDLPTPRPALEVWVYSPRVEGVHVRLSRVAQGAVRWSDRREDFRAEILGILETETLRNTVIVPAAARGGFVAKRLPDPSADRSTWLEEVLDCYETFISALLDITDNMAAGEVVPPVDVVRHDEDDPYLWLAPDPDMPAHERACERADKVLATRGFWLSDGLADSTARSAELQARSAWESAKQRLIEAGCDAETQAFTAVAMGSVSRGTLSYFLQLPAQVRLLAAFDDEYIFLDPDPDPVTARAERQRLLRQGRSGWADYDSSLISEGGGVHPRTARTIPLSPQVRNALGIPAPVLDLRPDELLDVIVTAPVQLLAHGGCGVVVKTASERPMPLHRGQGLLLADSEALRATCLLELETGCVTQAAREEYALRGGLVCVDAVDLAAAVMAEDRRSNLAIAAGLPPRRPGQEPGRVAKGIADRISADAVTRGGELQRVIALEAHTSHASLEEHRRALSYFAHTGHGVDLERVSPERRMAAGVGLTRPELSLLVLHAHAVLQDETLKSGVPQGIWAEHLLEGYVSALPLEHRTAALETLPLRDRIAAAEAAWDILKALGPARPFTLVRVSDRGFSSLAQAFGTCRSTLQILTGDTGRTSLDHSMALALALSEREALSGALLWLLAGPMATPVPPGPFDGTSPHNPGTTPSPLTLRPVHDLVRMGLPPHLVSRTAELARLGWRLDALASAARWGEDEVQVTERFAKLVGEYGVDEATHAVLTRVRMAGVPVRNTDATQQVALLGQIRIHLTALVAVTGSAVSRAEQTEVVDRLLSTPIPATSGNVSEVLQRLHAALGRSLGHLPARTTSTVQEASPRSRPRPSKGVTP